jgi:hypothetical protein
MPRFTFADGRPNVAAPPRCAAVVRAGPPSAFAQLRALHERHRREDAVIREVLRRARAARRPAWRPPVLDACPASTPRPRERGARVVAASGRDGTGKDDGSGGGDDDGGGGSDPPPPPSPAYDIAGGAP